LCDKDRLSQFSLTKRGFRENLHVLHVSESIAELHFDILRYINQIHTYKNVCIIAPDFNGRLGVFTIAFFCFTRLLSFLHRNNFYVIFLVLPQYPLLSIVFS